MRGIHLFWCQAGNLEAVRAFPAPTVALTGWEPQTHPSTRIPRHILVVRAARTNHPNNTSNTLPRLQGLGGTCLAVQTHVVFGSCFRTRLFYHFSKLSCQAGLFFFFFILVFWHEDEIVFSFNRFSCSFMLSRYDNEIKLLRWVGFITLVRCSSFLSFCLSAVKLIVCHHQ